MFCYWVGVGKLDGTIIGGWGWMGESVVFTGVCHVEQRKRLGFLWGFLENSCKDSEDRLLPWSEGVYKEYGWFLWAFKK